MLDDFEDVAREIASLSQARKDAAAVLLAGGVPESLRFDFLEAGISLPVPSAPFSGRVLAVDGGIVAEEFHSVDLFCWRACAAVFDYSGGRLSKCSYYPSPLPKTRFQARHSLQSHEFNWAKSLLRLESEITCAAEACRKHEPQVVLLDGSIVPQVGDKPSRDSQAFALYERALDSFACLFEECEARGVVLAGVIKDSRGRHFLDLLLAHCPQLAPFAGALGSSSDSAFLSSLLQVGRRTPAFKYASNASETSVLKDLGEWGHSVASFYLRPAEFDRPLRVDFLSRASSSPERVAGVVGFLSGINRSYGYPAVLIEADLRAAMRPEELDHFHARLQAKLGFSAEFLALRRNSRPFR